MFQSLRYTSQERENSRKRTVLTANGAFRGHFALEEHESSIYPHTSGKSPQFMLPLASVAGLVVPGMEAKLENGCLNVVPFVLFLGRDVLHQLPGTHGLQLFWKEVAPFVLATRSRVRYAESTAFGSLGFIDLTGPRIGNPYGITPALVKQISGLAALNAGKDAVDGKCPVVGILVGSVAVDGLDLLARRGRRCWARRTRGRSRFQGSVPCSSARMCT